MPETSENLIVDFEKKFLEASILVLTALALAFIIGLIGDTIGLFLPGLDPESKTLLLAGSVAISIVLALLGFWLLVPPFTVGRIDPSFIGVGFVERLDLADCGRPPHACDDMLDAVSSAELREF